MNEGLITMKVPWTHEDKYQNLVFARVEMRLLCSCPLDVPSADSIREMVFITSTSGSQMHMLKEADTVVPIALIPPDHKIDERR